MSWKTDRIKAFAAEFDPQPFHLDEAAARKRLPRSCRQRLAHGGGDHALIVTGGLPLAGGMVGLGGEIAWPRPTRPGDTLRVESRNTRHRAVAVQAQSGVVTVHCITVNQNGEEVQVLTTKILCSSETARVS